MLRPLKPNRFRALAEDDIEDSYYIILVKEYFKWQNLGTAIEIMIRGFDFCAAKYSRRLSQEHWDRNRGPKEWCISFGVGAIASLDFTFRDQWTWQERLFIPQDRVFMHLSLKPNLERPTVIEVYEDDKYLQTYEMFNRPDQWQALVKWLWNYGNDRLIRQAAIQARRKGRPPLSIYIQHSSNLRFSVS